MKLRPLSGFSPLPVQLFHRLDPTTFNTQIPWSGCKFFLEDLDHIQDLAILEDNDRDTNTVVDRVQQFASQVGIA